MVSEMTLEKRRAYSKGYNAGRRGSWPDHKPPMPPHGLTANLIASARALRDGVDGELAAFLDDEPLFEPMGPLIDALDDSLAAISTWLRTQAESESP